MMTAMAQFFKLPPEERAKYFTTDHSKQVKLFNFYLKVEGQEQKVTMWSETFSHLWHPLNSLPENPPQYGLMKTLLGLLSQGLGLEKDCLQKKLDDNPTLKAQGNYHPPCPDPEVTLGLAIHTDLNALTVLKQTEGVTGLQVIKDGKWVAVDSLPQCLCIRVCTTAHRAVTNKIQPRLSLAMFYGPNRDTVIGPIKDLIDEQHSTLYRNYKYAEFLKSSTGKKEQEGARRFVKEVFELQN
ncbi:hypothetical protein ACFX15_020751 [Malus domestica]